MKAKLTQRIVGSVEAGRRDLFVWDAEVPGFGLKVTPTGKRVYILQYTAAGRTRRYTIGRHDVDYAPGAARQEAKRLRGVIAQGGDPAGARARQRAVPDLTAFAERYLAEHAELKKKPVSVRDDRQNLRNHILPRLGKIRISDLTRADVQRLHAAMKDKPIAANRCLALLSKMCNLAELWGLRPEFSNPTRHIGKYRETKRERFLSEVELACLGETLSAAQGDEPAPALAAVRLLIFTGCRLGEVLTLRWDYVDFERACLRLPDSKTGAKLVPLGAPALEILAALPRVQDNPHVLPGRVEGGHFIGLQHVWQRLRKAATVRLWARQEDARVAAMVARQRDQLGREPSWDECRRAARAAKLALPTGMADVRLHDLRHSFASVGVGLGEGLVVIGALLGHASPATTKRYAHLSTDPLRAAADQIASHIAATMTRGSDNVVALRPGAKSRA